MRQKGLFAGATLCEKELEELLKPIYPQLWGMIHEPFVAFKEFRRQFAEFRILTEGESAGFLRPQIVNAAKVFFNRHPDVRPVVIQNQFFLNYKSSVLITPKKFRIDWRGRLTFSSYRTRRNVSYWEQGDVDGVPDLPRLIVGYKMVSEMTDIQILVAYPRGRRFRLCYLMPDQSGTSIGVHHEEVIDGAPKDKGFKVKPKRDVREQA